MNAALTIEMYLNNGQFYIGSTDLPPYELGVGLHDVIAACDTHLLVRAITQTIPVRVSVSGGYGPAGGHMIYDGSLTLPGEKLYVGTHFLGGPHAVLPLGSSGPHRVLVFADEIGGEASRFSVILDPERVPDGRDSGEWPPLPIAADQRVSPATELGIWLAGHDRARLRLHQAFLIVHGHTRAAGLDVAAFGVDTGDLIGEIRTARIGTDYFLRAVIKCWLRWLDPGVTEQLARQAVDSARDVLIAHIDTATAAEATAAEMLAAADHVLAAGLGYHVLLWRQTR